MRVSFEGQAANGAVRPIVKAAKNARERDYCRTHGEFSERMIDPAVMRVAAFIWDIPATIPCGCCDPDCDDCATGAEIAVSRVYYEAWEHPALFEAAARALAEPLGACDAVLLVPKGDASSELSRADLAAITARDISEISLVRHGYYDGSPSPGLMRTVLVHHAAASLLAHAGADAGAPLDRDEMDHLHHRLIEWALRQLTGQLHGGSGTPAAWLDRNDATVAMLNSAWEIAADLAPTAPYAPNALLPAAETIADRVSMTSTRRAA